MGKRIFDVGREAGLGSTAKMINQLLCGVHIAAAAEAMKVAERAGRVAGDDARDHLGVGRQQLDVG